MKTLLVILSALMLTGTLANAAEPATNRLNMLFFTADDMNFDSSDVYGGPIRNLTPNIDRLAAEGLRFQYAYSTVAVCQPVRQIMQTGLYPHRNGAMGFFPSSPRSAPSTNNFTMQAT